MSPSTYKFLADALVAFHFGFVAFVMVGGLLVLRWRRVMWLHLPAVAWGIWIELYGGLCPLTPLENQLRDAAGQAVYGGSFVDHYIMPVLYPEGLTRNLQFAIAAVIVMINGTCYGYLLWRRRQRLTEQAQELEREQELQERMGGPGAPSSSDNADEDRDVVIASSGSAEGAHAP